MEKKYYFNQDKQALDICFNIESTRDEDWQEIDQETHLAYFEALNSGRVVIGENEFSEPKPTGYHVWNDGEWIDPRTPEQIRDSQMGQLKPLTRRQFRMVFILNGYDLDAIKAKILEIEDTQTRQLTLVEWEDATTFERDNALLIMMAELLGLEDDQVNAMWKQALTL